MRSFSLCVFLLLTTSAPLLAQTVSEQDLYNFTEADININFETTARIVQAADGNDYGLMNEAGIFFALQPNGTFTEPGGVAYLDSDLVQGPDGNFYFNSAGDYGADSCSGAGCGSIDRITPAGAV